MRLAAKLAHGLDDLRHAATIGRMVVAEPATVGVEREPADAGDQVAVGYELAALALLAEPEIFERHDDGDREAVVDRRVIDVRRLDAGPRERRRTRPHRARVAEIDLAAQLELGRLAGAEQLDARATQVRHDLGRYDDQGAAAVADHAAVETMQRIRDHRRVD